MAPPTLGEKSEDPSAGLLAYPGKTQTVKPSAVVSGTQSDLRTIEDHLSVQAIIRSYQVRSRVLLHFFHSLVISINLAHSFLL